MSKYLFSLILTLTVSLGASAQKKINWLSWEEALEKNQKEPKKFLVDVYTNWCGWCKKMDKTTFSEPVIIDYVNKNYYAIKFDAENKSDIIFNNKVYQYVGSFGRRGHHELAAEITNGKLSFPTVVFIDEYQNVIQPLPGYHDAKTFEMIMTFFAEDHYQQLPWKKFAASFKSEHFPRDKYTPEKFQPKVQTVGNK